MYLLQHAQTKMYIARKDVSKSQSFGALSNGAAILFKWVRNAEDASTYATYSDAEMPAICMNLPRDKWNVVDRSGAVITREQAEASGSFF